MTVDQYILQPLSAPCFSGGYLKIKSRSVSFDNNRSYCVVFEDEAQTRYVVSANVLNVCCLICAIPHVLRPSSATVCVIAISSAVDFEQMLSAKFAFTADPIDPLAAYLAKNANCLDCDISVIEKVSNGLMGTFDSALSVALSSHQIKIDSSQLTPRLTLLHLVAYLGLEKTLNRLIISLPGCLELLHLKAPNGLSPVDLADGDVGDRLNRLSQADIQLLIDVMLSRNQKISGFPMIQDVVSTPISESLSKLTSFLEELNDSSHGDENEPHIELAYLYPSSPLKDCSENNGRASANSNGPNLVQLNNLIDHLYAAVTASNEGDLSVQRIAHSRSFSDLHTPDTEEPPQRDNSAEPQPRRDSTSLSAGLKRRNSLPSGASQRPTNGQDAQPGTLTGISATASPTLIDDDDKPNWSEWCAEHHPALVSTLTPRQRKLQDSIWEFIRTEHHHIRILSLLDRVYRRPLKDEFNMDEGTLEILFPNLHDLQKEHASFMATLRTRQKERLDRQIHVFSDLLLDQFTGEKGAAFSNLYAQFILHQYPAKKKYDELIAENKDFGAFVAKCKTHEASQRMGIPECRLRITQRITQMPLLVQAICKYVADDREKEEMNRALCAVRQVASHVNEQLDRQTKREKLGSIKANFDIRSTSTYKGKRFGIAELSAEGRQLRFYGTLQFRTPKGYREVLCLLMSDIFVLLTESSGDNNRYSLFTSAGNRQSVLSLRNIVTQAAVDGMKSKTIYIVAPNDDETAPADLYEFKCPNADNWREWLRQLKEATVDVQMGNGQGSQIQRSDVKSVLNELSAIQRQIDELCSSKNALLKESFAITRLDDVRNSTRLAIEASGERILSADRELRQLIEEIQRSFEMADLSSSRQRISGSVNSVNNDGAALESPDWRALTSSWLSSLHSILAAVSDLQREVANQKQQLVDIRLHPSYVAKLDELREQENQVTRLRNDLQQDREELVKKRVDIDNSFMYLSDMRKQHIAQCERETAEIRREKEELRIAKEKLAQQKEILQRQTDLNLQERAKVEEQKLKLKQQQLQMQEQAQLHASHSFMAEQLNTSSSSMHSHQLSPPAASSSASRGSTSVHTTGSIPHHLASFSGPSSGSPSQTSLSSIASISSSLHRGGSANSSTSSITPNRTSTTSLLPSKLEEQKRKK